MEPLKKSPSFLTAANVVTLFRLVLLIIFVALAIQRHITAAVAVFAVAWGLDLIDGYLARHLHQETRVGFILDKVVDRLLLVGGGVVLINQGYLPPLALLLFTKDVAVTPAFYIQIRAHESVRSLGRAGKIMTLLQGAALLWLVFVGTYPLSITLGLGIAGIVVGALYLHRVVYR